MMGIVGRYSIVIETDDLGGYRAIIEDWYHRAGHGDTPSEAMVSAIEYAEEWLGADDSEHADATPTPPIPNYRAARGVLADTGSSEPAEDSIRRLRDGNGSSTGDPI